MQQMNAREPWTVKGRPFRINKSAKLSLNVLQVIRREGYDE